MNPNAANLETAFDWLHQILTHRLNTYFRQAEGIEVARFDVYCEHSLLAEFIATHNPSPEEFTVLLLALIPHLKPGFLSKIIADYLPDGGDFPEFGGVKATQPPRHPSYRRNRTVHSRRR